MVWTKQINTFTDLSHLYEYRLVVSAFECVLDLKLLFYFADSLKGYEEIVGG